MVPDAQMVEAVEFPANVSAKIRRLPKRVICTAFSAPAKNC
jgi:hypothetical protein